jgi:ectoine hydroxylase-related dioxygenase (phytanoyl-CoA dioxygenase family)
MRPTNSIPQAYYGVLQQNTATSALDEAVEQVKNLGYAILDAGYSEMALKNIAAQFDMVQDKYIACYGAERLKSIDEYHTIRSPLTSGNDVFLELALNSNLLTALKSLIQGSFILNQQNGIVNPPRETYNQASWHRDLPYQHFVSSAPLAINALFCIDDFTVKNGATYVLPASHKSEAFPSASYIERNALQVEAKAGSYILLDCMLFHAGGFNATMAARRAVNHVFNIPFFKQQINIPANMQTSQLSAEQRKILGFNYTEPRSVADYLAGRATQKG